VCSLSDGLPAKLFSEAEFGFERKERDIRFETLDTLGMFEVMSRRFVMTSLKSGRIVARDPAIIPVPGSIVDQMAVLVALPGGAVSYASFLDTSFLTEEVGSIRKPVDIEKADDGANTATVVTLELRSAPLGD
jgi:hypothetical protein